GRLAGQVEQALRGVPGAVGIRNSNDNRQTQVRATIDWARAADLGVSPQAAGTALRTAIDGFTSSATQFRQPGRTALDIRVLGTDRDVATVEDIAALPVQGSNGVVRLGQFAEIRELEIPTSIRHVNRLRSVRVSAEVGRGWLLGDVQAAVSRSVGQIAFPPGYAVTYSGQGQQGSDAFVAIFRALGVAI